MQGIAFGPTIRLLRQAKGISLREMARQLGVSPAFLSQIEAGRQHKIPRARIVQVAEMLGVSEGYLLGTAKQVHPDLMTFLSETPEAAEFMVTAMRTGMMGADFNNLREIVADKKTKTPFDLVAVGAGLRVYNHAVARGLFIRNMGDRVAICPPLVINESELGDLFGRLRQAFDAALADLRSEGLFKG